MAILNYTTTIAADKTLAEIQRILATHGARSIIMDYDGNGNPTAVEFMVKTQYGERGFRLPANVEAVFKVLTNQNRAGKVPRRFVTKEQASRVAWRIAKDWLEAQMAIIEAEMVTMDEVFLPYMIHETGKTFYQVMIGNRLMLPATRED